MTDPTRLDVESPNFICVELGKTLTVWFSYGTPVAFAVPGLGRIKSENVWSRTTGKHLNSLYARETLPYEQFTAKLAEVMATLDTAMEVYR